MGRIAKRFIDDVYPPIEKSEVYGQLSPKPEAERKPNENGILRCWSCRYGFMKGKGLCNDWFCSEKCRDWYDNGDKTYNQNEGFHPEPFKGYTMGPDGSYIICKVCEDIFESKGMGICNHCLKLNKQEREHLMTIPTKLKELVDAIEASRTRIKCQDGEWVIYGNSGYIWIDDIHWHLKVTNMSRRYYSSVKKKLSFMSLERFQEAREVGAKEIVVSAEFKLTRLPTPKEAEMLRKILAIKKRPTLTEEHKKRLSERFSTAQPKEQGRSSFSVDFIPETVAA
jgi:hypothetical protein